jgi:hypothetical protein
MVVMVGSGRWNLEGKYAAHDSNVLLSPRRGGNGGFFFNSTARPTHKSTKTQLAAHQSSQATTLFFNRSAKAETSQRKGRVAAANGKKFSIPKAN